MIRFFFIGLLICFSCVSPNKLTVSKPDFPLITMRRTACFGTCPQYTISIYDDGTINYEGKLFVEKIGNFHSNIPVSLVQKIKSKLEEINFFSFKEQYDSPITDVPSVIIQVSINGKTHKVIDRFRGPNELKYFQNFIDSISESVIDWDKL